MRVRISTYHPLPPLKAWFPIDEQKASSTRTVLSLKKILCTTVDVLRNAGVQGQEIALLLDDFDLLDETTLDVLRDGDLICIQRRATSMKRKAEVEDSPQKRTKVVEPVALHKVLLHAASSSSSSGVTNTSSDTSDTSSDDSSNDSSDDSSDDSSSSSDSSSPSSSAPIALPSKQRLSKPIPANAKPTTKPTAPNQPSVPPGYGKPSTHSRNLRRRKKRQYERPAAASTLPLPIASANATPLGIPSVPSSTTALGDSSMVISGTNGTSASDQVDMMALSNKNKRRRFKRSMAGVAPQHITFDDSSQTLISPTPGSISAPASRPTSPTKFPRLIPPSEKQELGQLPPNMFVTSVDVEEGLWPRKRKNEKGRKYAAGGDKMEWEEEGWDRKQKKRQRDIYGLKADDAWDGGLPYDDETAAMMGQSTEDADSGLDWQRIEKEFDALSLVLPESILLPNNLVGWKELGIHPVTLTPEMILTLARITRVDPNLGRLWIRVLVRPSAVTFRGAEENAEIVEEVEYTRMEVDTLGWRLVLP